MIMESDKFINMRMCGHSQPGETCWYCGIERQLVSLTEMYQLLTMQVAALYDRMQGKTNE